ncbi:MAG: sensor histidine kinase [Ancrocorticia sp.]
MATRWRKFYTFKGVSPFDVALSAGIAYLYFGPNYWHNLPFHELTFAQNTNMALPEGMLTVLAILAGILYSTPTVFRRTKPEISAALVFVGALLRYTVAPWDTIPPDLAVLVSLYAVTVYGAKWAHRTALIATFLGVLLIWQTLYRTFNQAFQLGLPAWRGGFGDYWWGENFTQFVFLMLVVIIVYTVALLRRNQLQQVTRLVEEADEARRRAEQETELAVLEERSRIAREMHDVVAHTLSVVIAQADGGRYAAANNPAAAVTALETIADMSRGALKDIRSIIGVLRSSTPEPVPLLPQPVAEDLDALVEKVRSSGTDIALTRIGSPHPLPTGVGTAIYRICQESITNTLKHAGPDARISVILQWMGDQLVVQIDDDGTGPGASDGKGHGIIGMKERASTFGGSVHTGPIEGGGFRVIAAIPLDNDAPIAWSAPAPQIGRNTK